MKQMRRANVQVLSMFLSQKYNTREKKNPHFDQPWSKYKSECHLHKSDNSAQVTFKAIQVEINKC